MANLCRICQNLDIDNILPTDRYETTRIRFHRNFDLLRVSAQEGCSFCSLVFNTFSTEFDEKGLSAFAEKEVFLGMLASTRSTRPAENNLNKELMVWIGDREPALHKNTRNCIRFSLCMARSTEERRTGFPNHRNPEGKLVSRRPICSNPSSAECFDIARAWLRQCISERGPFERHAMCDFLYKAPIYTNFMYYPTWSREHAASSFMPTRTVNVSRTDREPFLEIHTEIRDPDTRNPESDWATLSHCWGGSSPLTTTTETLEARRLAIPLASMPKTFRDAVTIARELGIRHLWIDSLCILQDSKEDWEQESARMAEVYRHGLVNIAATTSQHADAGILKSRQSNYEVVLPFKSKERSISCDLLVCPAQETFESAVHGSGSVLRARGWVLQESFLSPRTIHFAAEQMFWECVAETVGEGTMDPVPEADNMTSAMEWANWDWLWSKRFMIHPTEAAAMFMGADERKRTNSGRVWYNRWYSLVSNYSSRKLSFANDIFPALGALASVFSNHLKDKYVAGLFLQDIILGLLWETDYDENTERCVPYRAPTWSWASVKGRVEWPMGMTEAVNLTILAKYVDHTITTLRPSTDPKLQCGAQIVSATLRISGWLRARTSFPKIDDQNSVAFYRLHEHTSPTSTKARQVQLFHRLDIGHNFQRDHPSFREDWFLFLVAWWESDARVRFQFGGSKRVFALFLKPTGAPMEFERLGVAHLWPDDGDNEMVNGFGWSYEEITVI